jgi:hypothetical protein
MRVESESRFRDPGDEAPRPSSMRHSTQEQPASTLEIEFPPLTHEPQLVLALGVLALGVREVNEAAFPL